MTTKIRVLVADDTLIARAGWRDLISTEPDIEIVGEAVTSIETVHKVRELRPDVLLMDLRWFEDDSAGIAAITQIKRDSLPTKILAVTGYSDLIIGARKAGAEAVLSKGFSRAELMGTIRSIVHMLGFPPPAPELPPADRLSDREIEVLALLAEGLEDKEIARALDIAPATARNHVANLTAKLGARNRTHAVSLGHDKGLIRSR